MADQLIDKTFFFIGMILFISDMLFPLWLIGLLIFFDRKGWQMWKAWGVASSFSLAQAYFVAKTVGHNIGAYILIGTGTMVSSLFYDLPPGTSVTSYLTPFQMSLVLWVAPPVAIIILPTFVLFVISKLIKPSDSNNNYFQGKKPHNEVLKPTR